MVCSGLLGESCRYGRPPTSLYWACLDCRQILLGVRRPILPPFDRSSREVISSLMDNLGFDIGKFSLSFNFLNFILTLPPRRAPFQVYHSSRSLERILGGSSPDVIPLQAAIESGHRGSSFRASDGTGSDQL